MFSQYVFSLTEEFFYQGDDINDVMAVKGGRGGCKKYQNTITS